MERDRSGRREAHFETAPFDRSGTSIRQDQPVRETLLAIARVGRKLGQTNQESSEEVPVRCERRAVSLARGMGGKGGKLEDLGYATLTVPDHLTNFFAPCQR